MMLIKNQVKNQLPVQFNNHHKNKRKGGKMRIFDFMLKFLETLPSQLDVL